VDCRKRRWLAPGCPAASGSRTAPIATPDAVDDPAIPEQTANYLRDFNKAVAETATAEELYDRMLALYPRRAHPGALWGGSKTVKPAHS
jgi:hypothetical protein